MRKLALIVGVLLCTLGSLACDRRDYFGEVTPECKLSVARCEAAIEKVIPLNEESLVGVPDYYRHKIIEAFHAIYRYPLKFPPQKRIFGVAPNSIPLWVTDIFTREETFNKSLFNHILNLIQEVRVIKRPSWEIAYAKYSVDLTIKGILNIYDDSLIEIHSDVGIAALFVHEARHGDGYYHMKCPIDGRRGCDADLSGPHGMATAYREMLIHGNQGMLSELTILLLARDSCFDLKSEVLHLPDELAALLADTNCSALTSDWINRQEML